MTRKECFEQATEELVKSLLDDVDDGYVDIDVIHALRRVRYMARTKLKEADRESLPMDEEDTENSVGVGWVEYCENDPESGEVFIDMLPCVWVNGVLYDGESEGIMLFANEPYWWNKWGEGYRVWTDGRRPTKEKRKAWEWRGESGHEGQMDD